MERKYLISLIIPVYNIKPYVTRCLDSVANQTCQNFECIVVDDGATDGSAEICDRFAQEHPNIKVVHQQNQGLMGAVRTGIECATGDYIMFLDGDDSLELDAVNFIVEEIKKKKYDIILYNYYKVDPDGVKTEVVIPWQEGAYNFDPPKSSALDGIFQHQLTWARWNKVVKKEIIKKIIPYLDTRIGMGEDANYMLPTLYLVKDMFYLKHTLINYYANATSFTHAFKTKYLEGYKFLYQALSGFFNDKDGYENVPGKVLFETVKSYVLLAVLYGKGVANKEIKRALNDPIVREGLLKVKPRSRKDKVIYFLMIHRRTRLLHCMTYFYSKAKKIRAVS